MTRGVSSMHSQEKVTSRENSEFLSCLHQWAAIPVFLFLYSEGCKATNPLIHLRACIITMQQQQSKSKCNYKHTGSTREQLKKDRILPHPLHDYQKQGVWLSLLIERGINALAITRLLLHAAVIFMYTYLFVYIWSQILMHRLAYFIIVLQPFSGPIVPECHLSHASVRWGLFQ